MKQVGHILITIGTKTNVRFIWKMGHKVLETIRYRQINKQLKARKK